jgi:ubiquinone/menaquinone biosynthesis C-methylase UbiE
MGFYDRHIVPRINDKLASGPEADRFRNRLLSEARGSVLDVGFGTGLNAPHYDGAVERVVAVEPNPGVEKLARKRIAAARVPIELVVASGEELPFESASFDTVVTTLVLCSIPDVERALKEIRRVLKPGGRYLFLEHGLADDESVQKWQHRLNGVQKFMAGGCNLNRPIRSMVEGAGFVLENVDQFYFPKAPRFAGYTTLASARPS